MRAHPRGFGLTTVVVGAFLLFVGHLHIGCDVGGSSMTPTLSNCSSATDFEIGGVILIIAAAVMFAGMFVPDASSRYK